MNNVYALMDDFFSQKNTIIDCQIQPYNIKLTRPWKSASSHLTYRQGLLISLTIRSSLLADGSSLADDSISSIAECAPLPEAGTETLAQAQNFLFHKFSQLRGKVLDKDFLSDLDLLPACRFALESIVLIFIARQQQKSIAQLLNPHPARFIKTNIMLGALHDNSLAQAKDAEKDGFSCLKFKLGINSITTEIQQLHQLLEQLGSDTSIRIDANKSWSFSETHYLLNELQAYQQQINAIEEPLSDYDQLNYRKLQDNTSISLALDESLSMALADKSFPTNYPVKRIILKPMAYGGIIRTLELAEAAKKHNIECVITSAIETGYALEIISHCCAALDNNQHHGLATLSWLENPLISPIAIENGLMTIHDSHLSSNNISQFQ